MPLTVCRSLYDAVYLYLLTVNQTLSEDSYKDGRLIRNHTVGQRFTGMLSLKHTKAYSPVVVAKLETYRPIYTNIYTIEAQKTCHMGQAQTYHVGYCQFHVCHTDKLKQ